MKAQARLLTTADDPAKACSVEVEGANHAQMLAHAKRTAATFLKESFAHLVADAPGTATPSAYSPYRRHLGEDRVPIRWRMSVTIRLHPEIVTARRADARSKALAEHPRRSEDGA